MFLDGKITAKIIKCALSFRKGQDWSSGVDRIQLLILQQTACKGKCKIIAAGENTVGKPHAGSQHQEGIESKLWGTEPLDWVTQELPPPSVKAQLRTEGGDATDA